MQYVLNIPKCNRLIHTNVCFLFACTTVNFSKIFASSCCLWELQWIWTFHNINREWPNFCLPGVAVQLATVRKWRVTGFASITVHMEHSTIFTLHYFYHTSTAFVVSITNPSNLIEIITTAHVIGARIIKAIYAIRLSCSFLDARFYNGEKFPERDNNECGMTKLINIIAESVRQVHHASGRYLGSNNLIWIFKVYKALCTQSLF